MITARRRGELIGSRLGPEIYVRVPGGSADLTASVAPPTGVNLVPRRRLIRNCLGGFAIIRLTNQRRESRFTGQHQVAMTSLLTRPGFRRAKSRPIGPLQSLRNSVTSRRSKSSRGASRTPPRAPSDDQSPSRRLEEDLVSALALCILLILLALGRCTTVRLPHHRVRPHRRTEVAGSASRVPRWPAGAWEPDI